MTATKTEITVNNNQGRFEPANIETALRRLLKTRGLRPQFSDHGADVLSIQVFDDRNGGKLVQDVTIRHGESVSF